MKIRPCFGNISQAWHFKNMFVSFKPGHFITSQIRCFVGNNQTDLFVRIAANYNSIMAIDATHIDEFFQASFFTFIQRIFVAFQEIVKS